MGTANYVMFFRLIILTFLMALMHTLTNIVVLYQLFVRHENLVDSHMTFFKRVIVLEFQIAIGVAMFFNLCAVLFLGHLIWFHIMLQRKGMTTFEYIRWKEDRTTASRIKKEKTKERKALEKAERAEKERLERERKKLADIDEKTPQAGFDEPMEDLFDPQKYSDTK